MTGLTLNLIVCVESIVCMTREHSTEICVHVDHVTNVGIFVHFFMYQPVELHYDNNVFKLLSHALIHFS